ncbi:MAG: hypothetical protein ABSH51_19640 [Solirubrobacteraceae bacterium]|jgi:hypothetical protein
MRWPIVVLAVLALSGCASNLECAGHACVGDWKRDMALGGTVVRCADGSWSHAGGLDGACSGDGGVRHSRRAGRRPRAPGT